MRYAKWLIQWVPRKTQQLFPQETHYFPITKRIWSLIRKVIKVSAFCSSTFRENKMKLRLGLISVMVMASLAVSPLVPESLTQMFCCLYQAKLFGCGLSPPPRLEMTFLWLLQAWKQMKFYMVWGQSHCNTHIRNRILLESEINR